MRHYLQIIILGLLALPLSACWPKKGYPGPELPDEQISIIYTEYDSNSMWIGEAAMNGIEFDSSGIKVLPGNQDFEMAIAVKEPPFQCNAYPDFNYYGYNDCLKRASKKYEYCDCWDYLSVYKNCSRLVHDGTCRGTMTTAAGKQYDITAIKSENNARLSISERGSHKTSGKGTCNTYGQPRVETDNSYVGSGRYTANANGIYGCYGY